MQARDRSFLRRNDFVDFIGRSVSHLELRTSFRKRDDVFSPVPVSKFLLLVRFAFRIICGSQEVAQLLISFTMQASIWNLERSQGYVIIFLKQCTKSHRLCGVGKEAFNNGTSDLLHIVLVFEQYSQRVLNGVFGESFLIQSQEG